MHKKTVQTRLPIALTLLVTGFLFTGCRSFPGSSLLGWNKDPSPEVLANAGPAVTYPAPPNANATPQSIASVAGGTNLPDLEIDDGDLITPQFTNTGSDTSFQHVASNDSTVTNLAAARANGFASPEQGSMASDSYRGQQSTSGGEANAFGDRAFTPKPATAGSSFESESTMVLPTASSVAQVGSSNLTNGFTPPPTVTASDPAMAGNTTTGFTLPTDSPSFASIEPSSSNTIAPTSEVAAANPSSVDYTTASRSSDFASSTTDQILPPTEPVSESPAGYSPGSTASRVSYPTSTSTPTTSGSFFR
jgi:hypothetical protein